MNDLPFLLPIDWQEQIGWVLVHSVWQIALIAAVYAVAAVALRRASANVRYVLGCAALLSMVAAPVATFTSGLPAMSTTLSWDTNASLSAVFQGDARENVEGVLLKAGAFELEVAPLNDAASEPNSIALLPEVAATAPLALSWTARLESLLPWFSTAWLLGVVVLAFRPLLGLFMVHRLRTRGLTPLSEELRQLAGRLLMQLRINQAVEFAQSALVQVPSVVGYFRPIVLLPTSAVTGLGVDQLELLLAHELAHVRRHDYLVNLMQTIIETLLFYHPAMWWLSAQIRKERECCCDDVVVALCGKRQAYIRTLWEMENQRGAADPVLAVSGGSLAQRIRRLAFGQQAGFQYGAGWLCSFIVLGLIVLLLSLGQTFAEDAAVDPSSEQKVAEETTDESIQPATTLVGRIVVNGTPPRPRSIDFSRANQPDGAGRIRIWQDADKYRNAGLVDESLIVGDGGGIANVVVWARSKEIPPPPFGGELPPSIIRAKDGRFDPHVLVFWNVAPLKWVNDMEATNFHWDAARNALANRMMRTGEQIEIEVKQSETVPTELVSNIHPWMRTYIFPLEHPYFVVTSRDGRFEIKSLPTGKWEFAIWHERSGWLKTDRFPTGKFAWQIKQGENDLGDLLVESGTLTKPQHTQHITAESPEQAERDDPDSLISGLPTYADSPIKKALQAKIVMALDEIRERREGHVIVGRVLVEGDDDPTLVFAQMDILQDGYFAGPVGNLIDPVGFRMHGYAPYDLNLKNQTGQLIDVGTIKMRRLSEAELEPVFGRIEMEGDGDLETAYVTLTVTDAPINTPSHGYEPRSRWADGIEVRPDSAGRIYQPALSPIRYNVFVSAPGYVQQHLVVDVKPNEVTNLKTIKLEKPQRILLQYVVSDKPPFDLGSVRNTILQGGGRWQFTPHPYRWDLEFKQRNGRLYFDWSYGPIYLADLGPGQLKDFLKIEGGVATKQPRELTVTSGNVYLLRRPNWERGGGAEELALFKIVLDGPKRSEVSEAKTNEAPLERDPQQPNASRTTEKQSSDINRLDAEGFSQLHRAASGGHVERIHDLLVKGADVNSRQGIFLGTPLQYAAAQGHSEAVQMLIDHRAAVDARDANSRTPLIWAAMAGHVDVARRLLDAGADVNATNDGGWTPLHYATSKDHQGVAQLLIERGANDLATNSLGKTPQEFALTSEHLRQLLAEVRGRLPDGWQAEITPHVPSELEPPWRRNANPCLVVWHTEKTLGEPIAPGMPGGLGPDDRPWQPVHPRFYLMNVEFLSLDRYATKSKERREKLGQRQLFVEHRLAGIPRVEKEPTPPRPGSFRPENEAQEALVREYARLWAQTEPEQLPTHFYRSLAFIFDFENYHLRDERIEAEYFTIQESLESLLTTYVTAADRRQTVPDVLDSSRSLDSRDRPATIVPTPPPSDELFGPAATDPNQVIATVLGRDVLRHELEPPPQWHQTREEHLRKLGQTLGLESLEQYHKRRLFELTAKPLIEAYKKQHNLAPTDAEIKEFIEHHIKAQTAREIEAQTKLQKLRIDEARLDSSQVPLSRQAETLRQLEAIRKEIDAIENIMSMNRKHRSDAKFQRHFAAWQLDHWKLHSTLYKQYGGRVVWQQVGNEAIDAMRDFFRQEEVEGRLVIHDENLRRMFWEPFTQEKPSFVVRDPERVFSKPWPVDESTDDQ